MGGGRKKFLPEDLNDEDGQPGERKDKSNLVEAWLNQKHALGVKAIYVTDKKQLLDVPNDTDFVLGKMGWKRHLI